jgi:feruloyl esterase
MNLFCLLHRATKPQRQVCPALKVMAVIGLLVLPLSLTAFSQSRVPAVSCESLAKLALPDTTITAAQAYAAGEYKMPSTRPGGQGGPGGQTTGPIPAFCRITAEIKPASDSDIKIEVWLPTDNWNGKFMAAGSGGWGGQISGRNLLEPLQRGFAAAATDTGHSGNGGAFIPGHPEKLIDYAYRADHEMTLKAKAFIKAFYGVGPKHSLWVGCSLGGLEALIEARRYPEDYDGIVAGSPVNPLTRFNATQIWVAWLNVKYPNEAIPGSKFVMIHEAAMKACGTPVGLKQGFIEDPVNCRFDPGTLLCKGADAPDCLTVPQVNMLRKIYDGPVNPRTGESIFPGPLPGIELQYSSDTSGYGNGGTKPADVAVDLYKYAVYKDPNWDWKSMDFDTDIAKAEKDVSPLLDVPASLNGFLDRGGKLMIYIGGAETHNAKDLANFVNTVLKNDPGKQNQIRLFVNPGMGHCGGNVGCDTFEKLGTIDQWVETGKAPDQIMSSKVSGGKTIRTRPLCAYPAVAKYKGTGDMDDAASFYCAKP